MDNKKSVEPKKYLVTSELLMELMRYLMTRPYGEVVKLMNSLSTLTHVNSNGGKDVGKK